MFRLNTQQDNLPRFALAVSRTQKNGSNAEPLDGFQDTSVSFEMATPNGFEPSISALTGQYVNRYTTGPQDETVRLRCNNCIRGCRFMSNPSGFLDRPYIMPAKCPPIQIIRGFSRFHRSGLDPESSYHGPTGGKPNSARIAFMIGQ